MREYDIYVPITYNDGTPIEVRKFQQLQARLVKQFGGLTFFPQPNEGIWVIEDVTYRDRIVVYRVVTSKARSARRFLSQLKADLKKSLKQEDVFIVGRKIERL